MVEDDMERGEPSATPLAEHNAGSDRDLEASPRASQRAEPREEISSDKQKEEEEVGVKGTPPVSDPLEALPAELRDPPRGEPFPGISANVTKWKHLKEGGMVLSTALKNRRDFCNPHMMSMMIEYNDIDQYGSNYNPELWDPKQIPPEDFVGALEKEYMEVRASFPCERVCPQHPRKWGACLPRLSEEQRPQMAKKRTEEQRAKGKIDYVSGGVQTSEIPAGKALSSGQATSVSAAAAAAVAKARAATLSQQQQQASRPKKASRWSAPPNPIAK